MEARTQSNERRALMPAMSLPNSSGMVIPTVSGMLMVVAPACRWSKLVRAAWRQRQSMGATSAPNNCVDRWPLEAELEGRGRGTRGFDLDDLPQDAVQKGRLGAAGVLGGELHVGAAQGARVRHRLHRRRHHLRAPRGGGGGRGGNFSLLRRRGCESEALGIECGWVLNAGRSGPPRG